MATLCSALDWGVPGTLKIWRGASLVSTGPRFTFALSQVGPGGRDEEAVISVRRRGLSCTLPRPKRAVNARWGRVVSWRSSVHSLPILRTSRPALLCTCPGSARSTMSHWGPPRGEDFAATGALRVAAPVMGSRGCIKMGWFPLYEAPRWLLGASLISRRGQRRGNLVTRWDPARAPSPLPTRARPGLTLVIRVICAGPHDGQKGAPRGPARGTAWPIATR